MKFSLNWLREFVQLPANVEELADTLTMAGIEVESINPTGVDLNNVVVSQIVASKQHPNADRLTICTVKDGEDEPRQIVCGATNYKLGDKVPLALPGAVLPGGLKICASKLRGIESQGMLCSAKELGVADDAAGLLILPPDAAVGSSLRTIFPADTVIDLEITPNRGDLLSHLGLAREIAAVTGREWRRSGFIPLPSQSVAAPATAASGGFISISAPEKCLFYSAHRISNIKVGPSPNWLRAKLESAGIRSINNIVDISNFVMLELGQPTHAFDGDKIKGGINVRLARQGEAFLALDGKSYPLSAEDLVIADRERAIGIAGVMGGKESAVTQETKNILLESAYFLPASVRRTARRLSLPSDASYRFERGVDPEMVMPAAKRAIELMQTLAEGAPEQGAAVAGELPANPADVSFRYNRFDKILGAHLARETADEILCRFGLRKTADELWRIPSYRRDLQREEDLVEEIVRVYGIGRIPSSDRSRFTPATEADSLYDTETKLRDRLVGLGLNEIRSSSLVARDSSARPASGLELRNPLSEDHSSLRSSLVPGMLAVLGRNARVQTEKISLFEIGNVFSEADDEQRRFLCLGLWGRLPSGWRDRQDRLFDFFDLKGIVSSLPLPELKFRRGDNPLLSFTAAILQKKKQIGFCGQLATSESSRFGIDGPVLLAEIDLSEISRATQRSRRFSEIHRHPSIRRDIAMFVAPNVTHAEVVGVIASVNEPLLEQVELFDLFTEKVAQKGGETRKSLAYSLTYRDKNRTLTSEEVNAAHTRIRERLKSEVRAELRE